MLIVIAVLLFAILCGVAPKIAGGLYRPRLRCCRSRAACFQPADRRWCSRMANGWRAVCCVRRVDDR
jgi:hypothetical protein